jgi:hypothetical protein
MIMVFVFPENTNTKETRADVLPRGHLVSRAFLAQLE